MACSNSLAEYDLKESHSYFIFRHRISMRFNSGLYGGKNTLIIQATSGRLFVPAQFLPQPGSEQIMETNPGAITRPTVKIVINSRPARKLAWQLTPLTACLQHIEDGV